MEDLLKLLKVEGVYKQHKEGVSKEGKAYAYDVYYVKFYDAKTGVELFVIVKPDSAQMKLVEQLGLNVND